MTHAWKKSSVTYKRNLNPYVDWFYKDKGAKDRAPGRDTFDLFAGLAGLANEITAQEPPLAVEYVAGTVAGGAAAAEFAGGSRVPVPPHALNDDPDAIFPFDINHIKGKLPTDVPQDTVIVGVIDTGIGLGHERFRQADDPRKTRIISSWQQCARFSKKKQTYLPFGEEIYQDEIDCKIAAHSNSDGVLDDDSFNRALDLVQQLERDGQRDLDFAAAHGTHVADLAAGFDPFNQGEADKMRMIFVNLPAQRIHGSGGNFLAFWALYGVERILHVARALWEANKSAYRDVEVEGYPVVINFSYGMHAGSKDGNSLFERKLKSIVENHNDGTRAPARIVMPAGNDNVARGHARLFMGGATKWYDYRLKPSQKLGWAIQPEDHTPNFVELWLTPPPQQRGEAERDPISASNVTLLVSPPGSSELKVSALKEGEFCDLNGFARVYRRRVGGGQVAYLICVAQTFSPDGSEPCAPAGQWSIRLDYDGVVCNASFYIQSDQSGLVQSNTGRRSYFVHENYQVFLENGRMRDSFEVDYNDYFTGERHVSEDGDNWKIHGPMQIKGTLNALVTGGAVISVGGYRVSDGRPTIYSSTSEGDSRRKDADIEIIDVSLPSEMAPAHFGILAAGSRSGTVARLRGTSMAAGLATRFLAHEMTNWKGKKAQAGMAGREWLRRQFNQHDGERLHEQPGHYRYARALKAGVGRVFLDALPDNGRVRRL